MATQTTKFQGTKVRFESALETAKAITAINKTRAELTIANSGFAKGDMVKISGCGVLDGYYPVLSVATDKVTLSDEVDWQDKDVPTSYANAKAARVTFTNAWCAVKNIEKSEDTLSTEDVTTVCSEGTETEPGEIEYGSLKLNFFYAPDAEVQKLLRRCFHNKETFAYKLELPNSRGTAYGAGFLESANGFSGEVKGKYDSSISIKPIKRDYLMV